MHIIFNFFNIFLACIIFQIVARIIKIWVSFIEIQILTRSFEYLSGILYLPLHRCLSLEIIINISFCMRFCHYHYYHCYNHYPHYYLTSYKDCQGCQFFLTPEGMVWEITDHSQPLKIDKLRYKHCVQPLVYHNLPVL